VARSATRGQIRTRAFQLANVINDPSFPVTKGDDLINLHTPAVYDELVIAGPPDAYSAETQVSVTAGTTTYALPVDFLSLTNVLVHEGDDYKRPIDPIGDRQRQHYRSPQSSATITIEYIPSCPTFDNDADTFDGISGWEELISARVARDILVERQGDTSTVMAIIGASNARIRSSANQRQRVGPKYLPDVESDICWPYSVQIDAWRLRGDNIEFYTSLFGPTT
jgi:hypothetical protein